MLYAGVGHMRGFIEEMEMEDEDEDEDEDEEEEEEDEMFDGKEN